MGDNDYTGEIAIITIGSASLLAILTLLCKFAYKLKCDEVSLCCGGIVVKRDIPDELKSAEEQKGDNSNESSQK
jgi:hypothetical protein